MAPHHVAPLEPRRFLFVTGKGGVGKTTVCASVALALAARGNRVLVAMCGAHERLSAIVGSAPVGHDIEQLGERLWATKIEPERAMKEYGQLIIRVKAISNAVFDNQYTSGFFRAVPGLFEWAMLGKAWYHTTEQLADGSPRFDCVIFDAPSTGHGLDMLRVPKVIVDIVPPGILRRDAERAWRLFRDPARAGVLVVTQPEEMPVAETIELVENLRRDVQLPIHRLIINGVLQPLFGDGEREALLADEELLEPRWLEDSASAGDRALALAARRAAREQLQSRCLARLKAELDIPTIELPWLPENAGTPEGAGRLAERF